MRILFFYDANDTFIDDADLEEVNACDDRRAMPGGECQGRISMADAVCGDEEAGEADEAQCQLDLSKFKLTAAEISGTSGDSSHEDDDAASQGDEISDGALSDRDWKERLEHLSDELVWEAGEQKNNNDPSVLDDDISDRGARPQGPCDASELMHSCGNDSNANEALAPAVNAVGSESFIGLRTALQSCCNTMECARAKGECQNADLEGQLALLWRQIPSLIRPHSEQAGRGRWMIRRLERPAPAADLAATGPGPVPIGRRESTSEVDLFGWTIAEEVAWARFLLCLVVSAARLPRSVFRRCWFQAVREPQREAMVAATNSVENLVRTTLDGNAHATLAKSARLWSNRSSTAKATCTRMIAAMEPLEGALANLRECWCRQRFWEDQRRNCRFIVPSCRRLDAKLQLNFAAYAANKLRDFRGLALPREMVSTFLNRRRKSVSVPVRRAITIQLPIDIFLQSPLSNVKGILHSVMNMDRQRVVLRSASGENEFWSLDDALRFACAGHQDDVVGPTSPTIFDLSRRAKQRHAGWHLFHFQGSTGTTKQLAWSINRAHSTHAAPFLNPPGVAPCKHLPPLPQTVGPLKAKSNASALVRRNFLRNLQPGQWVSCKSVEERPGPGSVFYNAKILTLCAGDQTWAKSAAFVDLELVGGLREHKVNVRRLRPPYVWEPGSRASVYDRGQWWQCNVKTVSRTANHALVRFVVVAGHRELEVGLDRLRRVAPSGNHSTNDLGEVGRCGGKQSDGSGRLQAHGDSPLGARDILRSRPGNGDAGLPANAERAKAAAKTERAELEAPAAVPVKARRLKVKVSATGSLAQSGCPEQSRSVKKEQREQCGLTSTSRPGKVARPHLETQSVNAPCAGVSTKPAPMKLLEGTPVRYKQKGNWRRGKVASDSGSVVHIQTNDRRSGSIIVQVGRDMVNELPECKRKDIISIVDSD